MPAIFFGQNTQASGPTLYTRGPKTIVGATTGAPDSVTTAAFSTIGMNLTVVGVCFLEGVGSPVLTDLDGNTYLALTSKSAAPGDNSVQLFYCINPITRASQTITGTLTGSYLSVGVMNYHGNAPLSDTGIEREDNAGSGTSLTFGAAITPSAINGLLVTALSLSASDAGMAIDSGFTSLQSVPLLGSNHFGLAMADKIQTTAAAVQPQWQWTNATTSAATIAAWKN